MLGFRSSGDAAWPAESFTHRGNASSLERDLALRVGEPEIPRPRAAADAHRGAARRRRLLKLPYGDDLPESAAGDWRVGVMNSPSDPELVHHVPSLAPVECNEEGIPPGAVHVPRTNETKAFPVDPGVTRAATPGVGAWHEASAWNTVPADEGHDGAWRPGVTQGVADMLSEELLGGSTPESHSCMRRLESRHELECESSSAKLIPSSGGTVPQWERVNWAGSPSIPCLKKAAARRRLHAASMAPGAGSHGHCRPPLPELRTDSASSMSWLSPL